MKIWVQVPIPLLTSLASFDMYISYVSVSFLTYKMGNHSSYLLTLSWEFYEYACKNSAHGTQHSGTGMHYSQRRAVMDPGSTVCSQTDWVQFVTAPSLRTDLCDPWASCLILLCLFIKYLHRTIFRAVLIITYDDTRKVLKECLIHCMPTLNIFKVSLLINHNYT